MIFNQQANANESLSNVDVLCLDKTGTLTANRLQVSGIHPLGISEASLSHILGVMAASARTSNATSAAIAEAYPSQPGRLLAEVPFASARKWSAVALTTTDDRRRTTAEQENTVGGRWSVVGGQWSSGIFALGAPEFLRPAVGANEMEWQAIMEQARSLTEQGLRVLLILHHPDP